jgi:hypothetical protein
MRAAGAGTAAERYLIATGGLLGAAEINSRSQPLQGAPDAVQRNVGIASPTQGMCRRRGIQHSHHHPADPDK